MALVKITNGVQTVSVTEGAFKSIYRNLGFELAAKAEIKHEKAEKTEDEKEENTDELFVEELMEKPISEWNKDEVKRFAEIKVIDISGTKNPAQAKEIINAWLEENDK